MDYHGIVSDNLDRVSDNLAFEHVEPHGALIIVTCV